MKNQNNKITEGHTLLYFGAGWDFKPVSEPIYSKFNHFIFIDSLPKSSHYEPGIPGYEKSKNKEAFIKTLKKYALKHHLRLTNIKNNLLTFRSDKIKLEYYINTTVNEALDDPIIRKKINKAKWLHENGFYPYDFGLKIGDLPNLLEYRAKIHELQI